MMNALLSFALAVLVLPLTAAASHAWSDHVSDAEAMRAVSGAARWIRSVQIDTPEGLLWPIDAATPNRTSTDLYSGTPGVILFFLELNRQTGDKQAMWDARKGADALLALDQQRQDVVEHSGLGLYVGLSGPAFVLNEVYKATGEPRYRDGANHCVDLLIANAKSASPHESWSKVNDIISGIAGTGLFLLYAADEMDRDDAAQLAQTAGDLLIERAVEKNDGLMWRMAPDVPNTYPNFSHGTAGVSFFLIRLYEHTKNTKYLDAARKGATYLTSIAHAEANHRCLIPRFDPGEYGPGEPPLYYLGWCHGPAGTARLFDALFDATNDTIWKTWRDQLAEGLLYSGIPEPQPGFWNNVGKCCGNAGAAEFMLLMNRQTGESRYLDFAKKLTMDLLQKKSLDDGSGNDFWMHAENRVSPDQLSAQTGLMQGAAGIGLWLLELNAYESGRRFETHLPDDVD